MGIRSTSWLALATAVALAAGCGEPQAPTGSQNAAPATADNGADTEKPSVYQAALANSARPEADRQRDADRKPAEVLQFVGIEPGMTVLDMFSGGGWYAEVIAHVVGDSGKVIAHSNAAYKNFVGDALEERFASGRVPQATIMMAENNHLALRENSLDAVMLALSFHDLFHVDVENDWELLDADAFLAELKKGLKPGGIVAVIDHRAVPGAPPETGDSLHRIDPALVISMMEAAGFVLDGQSDLLRNADDDHEKSVFTPELRGKTDRFVMRFRNPA